MNRRYLTILMIIAVAFTACNFREKHETEPTRVPVSEEAAAQLESKLLAMASSPSDQVNVTVTEEEVTSYLQLRTQTDQVQALQVEFEPGQIALTGRATVGITQDFRIVASPRVEDGILQFDFHEATFGPVPIPGPLLSLVNDQMRQALTANQVGRVEQVDVGAGTLTIVGRRA